MPPTCVVLTYCPTPHELYGNLLTLRSFRVGFPDAELVVTDNASCVEGRAAIAEATKLAGGRFYQSPGTTHVDYLCSVLSNAEGEIWIIDPDVMFWAPIPSPPSIIWGRYLPAFDDPYSGCYTLPRLHTSLLGIADGARFRTEWRLLSSLYPEVSLAPRMWQEAGRWKRQDTAASLLALPHARFDEAQLSRYDHLFCGTHAVEVMELLPRTLAIELESLHARVKQDPTALRGAWRRQEEFFKAWAHND